MWWGQVCGGQRSEASIGGMVVEMSSLLLVAWTCRAGVVIEGWSVREQGVVEVVRLREVVRHLGVGGWS
jgi:hypothetical protein